MEEARVALLEQQLGNAATRVDQQDAEISDIKLAMRTLGAELKNSMAAHVNSMLVFQQRGNARMEQCAKGGQ